MHVIKIPVSLHVMHMNMPYTLYYSLLFTHYSLQTLQYNSTKVTSSAAACRLRQINGRIYYAYHNYNYNLQFHTLSTPEGCSSLAIAATKCVVSTAVSWSR